MINLAAAHSELDSFKRHVIPVAEFFDSKQILHLVTGDRRPEEVYGDFSLVFHSILNQLEDGRGQQGGGEDRTLQLGERSVVWVVGGPGSKKYERVDRVMREHHNWTLISTGYIWIIISNKKSRVIFSS